MVIKKSEVEEALSKMELKLFNRDNQNNQDLSPVLRMMNVFSEAYSMNYFPEESILLRESYQLLRSKGYYYTEEN